MQRKTIWRVAIPYPFPAAGSQASGLGGVGSCRRLVRHLLGPRTWSGLDQGGDFFPLGPPLATTQVPPEQLATS